MNKVTEVDVYVMGVLSDLKAIGRCLDPTWPGRYRGDHPIPFPERWGWRRKALRHRLGKLRRNLPHRSAWHGYHAEPRVCPPDLQRIGTGWTRRRALRSLNRYMAEAGA